MACQRCNSTRLLNVHAKAADCVALQLGEVEKHDYMPDDLGLGGGDYIVFCICLDCGQVEGEWPLPPAQSMDEGEDDGEDEDTVPLP